MKCGRARDDDVPVVLSRGEYRVSRETFERYGPKLLEALNAMPQERPNHYGHLLSPGGGMIGKSSKPRWDDCPGQLLGKSHTGKLAAPVDMSPRLEEIAVRQRKLSPHYPTIEEARKRLRNRRRGLGLAIGTAGLALWFWYFIA